MTLHQIIELIRYKLKAKKLHGVHSPFAYTFSEHVLYSDKYNAEHTTIPADPKYKHLLARIKKCYQLTPALDISLAENNVGNHTLLSITDDNAGHWLQIVNKHVNSIKTDTFVVIPGIHKDKRRSLKWKRITYHPKVMMSIDLYGIGLLIFNKDFKEKQHFVLKY